MYLNSSNFQLRKQKSLAVQRDFYLTAKFPGVIGAIDGTHIRVLKPSECENDYFNRKFFPSLNVQVIVDANGRLLHINCRWQGSSHDSFVLRSSAIWTAFECGQQRNGILLGDSRYPLKTWLLTPFLNPTNDAEKNFNSAQRKTRVIVEQAIGRWKRRFAIFTNILDYSRACQQGARYCWRLRSTT